jgi:8-oxo-dGTP pyrophosphatase MutT (NUDIX family)
MEKSPPLIVARTAIQDSHGRLLLLKRSPSDNHNADLWEFAGGKVDSLDEEHQARELMEETGLMVEPASPEVLVEHRIIKDGDKYNGREYIMYCRLGNVVSGELKLSDEHTAAMWVSRDYPIESADWLTRQTRSAAWLLRYYLNKPLA